MKRSILLVACIIGMLMPATVFAAHVTKVVITAVEPVVGKVRSFKASVPETASTEIYEVHWSGEFDNGKFVQGNSYTMSVKLRIKAGSSNVFAPSQKINATINGHKGKIIVNREYKAITVKYTWKELGGPNPNNPKTILRAKLAEIAASYTALNTDDDKVILKYLRSKLPGADIWSAGTSFKYTRKLPSETLDGKITVPIGITYKGVTLDTYNFSVVLPALSKSPVAAKLNADMGLMKTALNNLIVTAKTTGDDILAVVNAAAVNGSTARWDDNYKYNASTADYQGSIDGNIIIALGNNRDYFHAHKTLPINGTKADAAIDYDFSALSKALHSYKVNNSSTKEELVSVAQAAIRNGSKLILQNFIKNDATYNDDGKIVISFLLELDGKSRNPRISMKLAKFRPTLPAGISLTHDEWELLRLTNIERYKANACPLVMVAPLQDAADIRAKEIVIVMRNDHRRPDGTIFATAIDSTFRKGRLNGENCAQGMGCPDLAINSWMNSPGHKANMLNKGHRIFGCGKHYAQGKGYWVQLFSTGREIVDAITNTRSFTFDTLTDMEKAYLICTCGDGLKAYIPLDADYMVKNGNKYTLHLTGKSITVTVTNNK